MVKSKLNLMPVAPKRAQSKAQEQAVAEAKPAQEAVDSMAEMPIKKPEKQVALNIKCSLMERKTIKDLSDMLTVDYERNISVQNFIKWAVNRSIADLTGDEADKFAVPTEIESWLNKRITDG